VDGGVRSVLVESAGESFDLDGVREVAPDGAVQEGIALILGLNCVHEDSVKNREHSHELCLGLVFACGVFLSCCSGPHETTESGDTAESSETSPTVDAGESKRDDATNGERSDGRASGQNPKDLYKNLE